MSSSWKPTSTRETKKDTIEVTRLKARLRWLLKESESHKKEIRDLKDKLKKCNCGRASLKKHKRSFPIGLSIVNHQKEEENHQKEEENHQKEEEDRLKEENREDKSNKRMYLNQYYYIFLSIIFVNSPFPYIFPT